MDPSAFFIRLGPARFVPTLCVLMGMGKVIHPKFGFF
jgi:hypothetical protein